MERFKGKGREFKKTEIIIKMILRKNQSASGARGAVWLAHRPFKPAVAGSNPAGPAERR